MYKKPKYGTEGQAQGKNFGGGNKAGMGAAGQPQGSAKPVKPSSGAEGQHKAGVGGKAKADTRGGGYAF